MGSRKATTALLARYGMLKDPAGAAERFVDLRSTRSCGRVVNT
jgi:hypothetical protein